MISAPDKVLGLRRLDTCRTRRLILELAHRRRARGIDTFTFAEVERIAKFILRRTSRPTVHGHVRELVSENLIRRDRVRNATLWLTDLGEDVYQDWSATTAGRSTITPSSPTPLEEVAVVAHDARNLLDDLINRLRSLT